MLMELNGIAQNGVLLLRWSFARVPFLQVNLRMSLFTIQSRSNVDGRLNLGEMESLSHTGGSFLDSYRLSRVSCIESTYSWSHGLCPRTRLESSLTQLR